LNLSTESIEAAAQIGNSSNNPDPCSLGEIDHRANLSTTVAANAGSMPASMLIKGMAPANPMVDGYFRID